MKRLAVSADGPAAWESWRDAFARVAPDLPTISWFDPAFDPADASYALVWEPPVGEMARMANMRVILSTGAGVNHLVNRPDFPADVPLVRMGGDQTAVLMADYVMWAAIGLLRGARRWARDQEKHLWCNRPILRNSAETRVGVLGFGNLGAAVARRLAATGFIVSAWCRTPREEKQIPLFFGEEGLSDFLPSVDILVNLLPSTPHTRHIIDAELLSRLKPGADFINVGRGDHVVEDDLLAALASGQLDSAVLDVVATEPLSAESPLWDHPRITLTPHMASEASREAQAAYVAHVIRELEEGRAPPLLYRPDRGY
ncbi:2-hydroxyacid dehydrogenase [Acetobacter sp.]|uniref:2-hydroxyacid dehydrogenase n=1 Tax=Acetobacter sp. TaxID=440 RepID=UPI0025C062C4|nr:glyoxylate/hydroxypyruvate reductase A [Acetobacter sp.]MCH4091375.1 glyoxylate/hydroxypyruvate reductase A [Acetobacter sp.]MCI1299353.1 glyoxylate/hydroxypyruvate reductase A [Acetobacter sp.]MCI1316643.1 glyoxylate/hydroxypyruvate reductase A [Acetobacter sp.]